MIDHTSGRIGQQMKAVQRENLRRYAFHRMLQATDRVLWRVEEMNRDGVKTLPRPFRAEVREVVAGLPKQVSEAFRDTGHVQDTLDSLFEVQERLFRWRYPDWNDFDPDEGDYGFVAG